MSKVWIKHERLRPTIMVKKFDGARLGVTVLVIYTWAPGVVPDDKENYARRSAWLIRRRKPWRTEVFRFLGQFGTVADACGDTNQYCRSCGKVCDDPDPDPVCDECFAVWPELREECCHPDCTKRVTEYHQGHPGVCRDHVEWYYKVRRDEE